MRGTTGLLAAMIVAVSAGVTAADDRDVIKASCAQTLGLSPSGCECIADKATSEFNDKEFAFFMTAIAADQAARAAAQAQLTIQEQTHVASRMMAMPGECGG